MGTYKLQKMFKWFEKNNEKIKLVGENREFKFAVNKGIAPHLIGVQYMKSSKTGVALFEHIQANFFSDEEIFDKIVKNSELGYAHEFNKRKSAFEYVFKNIEDFRIVENTSKDTSTLKSDYFLIFKSPNDNQMFYLGLRKKENENFYALETFFKRIDDQKYYKGTKIDEAVTGLYHYNASTKKFEEFTFKNINLTKDEYSILNENGRFKDFIVASDYEKLKTCQVDEEIKFQKRIKYIINHQKYLENNNMNILSFEGIKNYIPVLEKLNENLSIKRELEYISTPKNNNNVTLKDLKTLLSDQEKLIETNENLYKNTEIYDKINDFFEKKINKKNILKELKEQDFPIEYIENFELKFKNEINQTFNKTKEKKYEK